MRKTAHDADMENCAKWMSIYKKYRKCKCKIFHKKKTNHVGLTCKSWKRDVQNHKTTAENIMKINPSKNVANWFKRLKKTVKKT